METKEFGSKEWFKEPYAKEKTSIYPEAWDKKVFESFNTDEKVKNAHIAYDAVTETSDKCYIYRRKEIDVPGAEYLLKLENVPEIIWSGYLERIKPLLEEGKLDVTSAPNVLLDNPPPLLADSHEMYNIFTSTFPDDFEADKADFILKIQKIHSLQIPNEKKTELFNEACKEFRKNFLEKILPKDEEEEKDDDDDEEEDFTYKNLLENIASHTTKANYFKVDNHDINAASKILTDGRIYQLPQGTHSWLNNLSWMLGHIHKGNSFMIFSPLTENVMRRASEGYANDLSGFAREIALLTKLNYQFTLNNSTLILSPPMDKSEIKNLHLKQAYMLDDAVEKYYKIAVEKFTAINQKEEKSTQITETISTHSSSSQRSNITRFSTSPISQPTEGGGSSEKRKREQTETIPSLQQEEQEEKQEEKGPPTKKPKFGEKGGGVPPPAPF